MPVGKFADRLIQIVNSRLATELAYSPTDSQTIKCKFSRVQSFQPEAIVSRRLTSTRVRRQADRNQRFVQRPFQALCNP